MLLPWLAVAPNRLLPGVPIFAIGALGGVPVAALAGLLLVAGCVPQRRPLLAAALAGCVVPLLLAGSGVAATAALAGAPPAARAALGAGAWVALAGALLLLTEVLRPLRRGESTLAAALVLGAVVAIAASGRLESLSISVEYAGRAERVHAALFEHLALAAASLGLALLVATPLALWAARRPQAEAIAGGILDGIQVIPAIALFGMLLPLLSLLLGALPGLRGVGFAAIGTTPAVLATGAYVALPLFRALRAGLEAAPPAVVEAGRAMGFSEAGLLAVVRLPLGLPVFRAGLRVAAVQAIGLATLGGLVGAGGLGAIVFEGMAQFSADLILLGALPVVALALAVDAALA